MTTITTKTTKCEICSSQHRAQIESELLRFPAILAIAVKYGVPPDALHRHGRLHMPVGINPEEHGHQGLLSEVAKLPQRVVGDWLLVEELLRLALNLETHPPRSEKRDLGDEGAGDEGIDKRSVKQLLALRREYATLMIKLARTMSNTKAE